MEIVTIHIPSGVAPPCQEKETTEPMASPNNQDVHVPLPPDLVSASSCSAVDDISDISSVEAQEDHQEDEAMLEGPRSIFGGYWKKSGNHPIELQRPAKAVPEPPADWNLDNDETSENTCELYERTLQVQEGTKRRVLFPNSSVPLLRKNLVPTSSTSALNPRIQKSCLRRGGNHHNKHHVVSFAPNVSVLEFSDPPKEASEGWSKWFH